MIPAKLPIQRPADARLLIVNSRGQITNALRSSFPNLLHPGDVVIANDAATLPASLFGVHGRSRRAIEVRLAGWESVGPDEVKQFSAVIFGEGDYHTPTERRPSPPELRPGDTLKLGPLRAAVIRLLGHPRLASIRLEGPSPRIWEVLARYGRPIQYSHIATPLAIWDSWTPIAGPPVAFEPPSAGFTLDWRTIDAIHRRGVHFATITHAAGISSTGDEELDARLPFDEPYRIPESAARSIHIARAGGGRVIAIGTTVVRALEHCVSVHGSVRKATGMACNKIGPTTELRAVDAVLSGTHEPGTTHYNLLAAFVDEPTLQRMDHILERDGYRTHEFGDSVFVEKSRWKSAYVTLGTRYENLAQTTLAAENLKKAYDLRDRVSQRERLFIEAMYYGRVTGEVQKSNEGYEVWAQTFRLCSLTTATRIHTTTWPTRTWRFGSWTMPQPLWIRRPRTGPTRPICINRAIGWRFLRAIKAAWNSRSLRSQVRQGAATCCSPPNPTRKRTMAGSATGASSRGRRQSQRAMRISENQQRFGW